MADLATKHINELEEQLQRRKKLQDITNRIHSAQNIKQILVDLKDGILNLFDAHSITIYIVDRMRNEIFSMFLSGSKLSEIRVPINNRSIAGYVANTGKIVNIADAYDEKELKAIDKELSFDSSWDKKSGFRTRQILTAPIFHNGKLMGVVQILNKKASVNGGRFSDDEKGFLNEITEVLGVAFFNQERFARRRKTRFDYLISRDLLKEEDLENAWEESREQKETMENFLMKKYKISKDDMGKSLAEFYRCKFVQFNDKIPIPGDLIKNLKKDYLRRELWVPISRLEDGNINILVDDPNNILKRDMIENLMKTKTIRYDVALSDDIVKFINYFYQSPEDETSISDILGKLDADAGDAEPEEEGEVVTESDSAIMQLVNKIINDAYNRRTSDIHIEPNIGKKNVEYKMLTPPKVVQEAMISRVKIMAGLNIAEKRLPQDGRIRVVVAGRDVDIRVSIIPTFYGERVVLRLLDKKKGLISLEDMGMSASGVKTMERLLARSNGIILVTGPTGSGHQSQSCIVNHREVGLHTKGFTAALRGALREDPDIILVG